ncbi:MAG: ATP-binding cassette domain-containing protein [Ignavibacteriaceae bacterium]|nr:ATP-binding cassette domain-containing protein [Ignavibacteriaceae bacterium]
MIELKNISLELTGRKILHDLSLKIDDGTISVILGPSGVGKSTILKIILGLLKVDSGKVFIDGKDYTNTGEDRELKLQRKIGMVFQGNALFDSLTVSQNTAYFLCESDKISREDIDSKVKATLAFVNLDGTEDMYPEQLSGGMKKRLAIARALIVEPSIILFDEPTTGLDPINSRVILNLIRNLKTMGTTSVIVTHIINDAIAVGDVLTVLNEGTVVTSGSVKDILRHDNPFIKEFLYEIYKDTSFISRNQDQMQQ